MVSLTHAIACIIDLLELLHLFRGQKPRERCFGPKNTCWKDRPGVVSLRISVHEGYMYPPKGPPRPLWTYMGHWFKFHGYKFWPDLWPDPAKRAFKGLIVTRVHR